VWWYTAVIIALGRLRQKDREFETSLGYIARTYLKNNNKTTSKRKENHHPLVSHPLYLGQKKSSILTRSFFKTFN
jgi:hypothetical protein